MAVVGVDFGTLHSKIGVARHRGIDIITNEVSNRATPSLVAFGPKQRSIGESAKTQETSNFRNTVGGLKRLLGRSLNDPEVQEVEKKFLNAKLVDVMGGVGVQVNYKTEPHTFSSTQLVAMYLSKLRDIAALELRPAGTGSLSEKGQGVNDIVIAIPGWYADVQRRALLDAASIAGLNVLRLINEGTAAALGYGITKSDLPDASAIDAGQARPRHVVFVDVGHSSLSCSIVAFVKGQLTVLASAYDRNLGGRDIDWALLKHFSAEFGAKYKVDVMGIPKAVFRLSVGCERLKKVLSANAEGVLSVESLMTDIDASSKLNREEMEGLIADVLTRIPAPLQEALTRSGLSLEDIDAVELIGGSTRIPAVRAKIQEVFVGKTLSTTLNQDEAVARGATFSCAMLSPVFRVRDFEVREISGWDVKMSWLPTPVEPEDRELTVWERGSALPSTKILSFYRKESFDITAEYPESSKVPGSKWIGKFTAKSVPTKVNEATGELEGTTVKLRTRLNQNGILTFEGAYHEEREEVAAETPTPEGGDMDVEGAPARAPTPAKKVKVKKIDIPFVASYSSLDKGVLEDLREKENAMWIEDKLVTDTEDRKNALEEYVYDTRSKLSSTLQPFCTKDEAEALMKALNEAEEWLYTEEGESATKGLYVSTLASLKEKGDVVVNRWKEDEGRRAGIASLRETLDGFEERVGALDVSTDTKLAAEREKVLERIALDRKWLEDSIIRQMERRKDVDPILTVAEMAKRRDEVIYAANPVLVKGKKVPPKEEAPKEEAKKDEKEERPEDGPSEMDID
ncbi:heat shock protein 70 family [Mycena floridula]|nr:heat shock protein 70 family [Mycena floridula]